MDDYKMDIRVLKDSDKAKIPKRVPPMDKIFSGAKPKAKRHNKKK